MATILIVDDSEFTRNSIARILTNSSHSFLEASDGVEALEIISAKEPDCVVLDLVMPKMGGKETLIELKKRGLKLPVVVLTADVQASAKDECLKPGASDLLNKPPDKDDLINAIERAISSTERVDK